MVNLVNRGRLRSKTMPRSHSTTNAAIRDFQMRRITMPGYPMPSRNFTKEEVAEYISGDQLTCLLCGKAYKNLGGAHLGSVHNITPDSYREMYGFYYGTPLVGKSVRDRAAETGKKNQQDGKTSYKNMLGTRGGGGRVGPLAKQDRRENMKIAIQSSFTKECMLKRSTKIRKLTDDDVAFIMLSNLSGAELGRKYGVSSATICNIKKKKYLYQKESK
jgi:predicted transcriptional regulator